MLKDKLFKGSVILFAGTTTTNVCNYLFQFFMGRNLSVSDFGALNSLLSLMMIISVPSMTIFLISTKYVSRFKAADDLQKVRLFQKKLFRELCLYGLIILVILTFLSPLTAAYLKINSPVPVVILFVMIFFSFIVRINLGIIQGLQKFVSFSINSALGGLSKLVFGIILVITGFKLNGAMTGILLSMIFIFLISFYQLKNLPAADPGNTDLGIGYKNIITTSLPVVLCSFCIMVLTNLDLILVKHYFSGEDAGIYASVAVLGRTIFYFPGVIVLAMFPMAAESHALKNSSLKLLKKTLGLTTLMAGTGLIILMIFPDLMLSILFGKTYAGGGNLLRIFSIAMFFMAMVNILANYFLAIEKNRFLWVLLGSCLIEAMLICFFHNSLVTVLYIITGITSVMLISLLFMSLDLKKLSPITSRI